MDDSDEYEVESIEYGEEEPTGRDKTSRVGYGQRVPLTANDLAAIDLNKELAKYTRFSEVKRREVQNRYVNLAQLRYTNRKLFAITLDFMENNPQLTPDSFKDNNIKPYLSNLIPANVSDTEKERLTRRYKAEMLIYYRVIFNHLQNQF